MNHGPAWVIFQEHYPQSGQLLLSLLSARKSTSDVVRFMEQLYVDRFCSIEARIAYKKSRKNFAADPFIDAYSQIIHLGSGPFLVGIPVQQVALMNDVLEVSYKIAVHRPDPFNPKWESRSMSLALDSSAQIEGQR
ncbi:hypothetical protein [Hydrogenophaga sp. NH-16]|uniref:hypothetical protein n=1 Tax=Hydrogenophaga sp. NH-16 TaxID=2184519 RepID=UPI000FDB22AE|nr:hypothetical protein [Hydrogenophaga sp. NH-16]